MSTENENKTERNLLCWEKLELLTSFFFTYSTKMIQENVKQLNFWEQALMASDLMDDAEHRKEFTRIIEMNQALAALSLKYSNSDIVMLLGFLSEGKAITTGFIKEGKEVHHA
jgi:hypothetical protein